MPWSSRVMKLDFNTNPSYTHYLQTYVSAQRLRMQHAYMQRNQRRPRGIKQTKSNLSPHAIV
jgi:hypothetical protein